jgi:TatA/E family protein of Tat protein translocase
MFGISGEHILILGIVLLIFGPRRLPELGNTMGKAIRNFKDAISGVEEAKFRKLEETEKNQQIPASTQMSFGDINRPEASQAAAPVSRDAPSTNPAAAPESKTI